MADALPLNTVEPFDRVTSLSDKGERLALPRFRGRGPVSRDPGVLEAEIAERQRALCPEGLSADCVFDLAVGAAALYWDELNRSGSTYQFRLELESNHNETALAILLGLAELRPGFLESSDGQAVLSDVLARNGRFDDAIDLATDIAESFVRNDAFRRVVDSALQNSVALDAGGVPGPPPDDEVIAVVNRVLETATNDMSLDAAKQGFAMILVHRGAFQEAIETALGIEDFWRAAETLALIAAHIAVEGQFQDVASLEGALTEVERRIAQLREDNDGEISGWYIFFEVPAIVELAHAYERVGLEERALEVVDHLIEGHAESAEVSSGAAVVLRLTNGLELLEQFTAGMPYGVGRVVMLAELSLEYARVGDLATARRHAESALAILEGFAMSDRRVAFMAFNGVFDALFAAGATEETLTAVELYFEYATLPHPGRLEDVGVAAISTGETALADAILSNSADWYAEADRDRSIGVFETGYFIDLVDAMTSAAAENGDYEQLCRMLTMVERAFGRGSTPVVRGFVTYRLAEVYARVGDLERAKRLAALAASYVYEIAEPEDRLAILARLASFLMVQLPVYEAEGAVGRPPAAQWCAGPIVRP